MSNGNGNSNNNNNKQPLDVTDYDGISQRVKASTTTPIIDPMGFLLGCVERGEVRKKQPPPSICKVSRALRDLSKSSFNPQLVSIGPIHREDPKLQEYEGLKECYLDDLLNRCDSTPEKTLEACLLKVNPLIPRIKESYAGMIDKYSGDELARMMVMDGCFILEFCFKHVNDESDLPNHMQSIRVAMDLTLLENQVPFVVLQALFDCTIGWKEPDMTLSRVLVCLAWHIKIFGSCSSENTTHFNSDSTHDTTDVDSDSTHDHVLGYLHKRYQLVASKSSDAIHASHSIVELDRSGMNFKPHQESGCSMTIRFQSSLFAYLPWFKPTLLMPILVIDDTTELILRNLIAYEQSFPKEGYYFTSYAYAMDMLIDTQEDIAKLVESKVIVNMLGSNQKAADMINNICKNINITKFYYSQEFNEIDEYYNGYWPKNIAWLRRTYFNNPWSAIALVAAIILFSLTVVQTVFTIRAA